MSPPDTASVAGRRKLTRRDAAFRFIAIVLAVGLASLLVYLIWPSEPRASFDYQGHPPEAWFYGNRSKFFTQSARDSAQKVLDELGTNAFPFLLSVLTNERGSTTLYFKAHQSLPSFAQFRLPYPVLRDDIKAIALNHLRKMRALTTEDTQRLAECVPHLENPRLRMQGFNLIQMKYETHPAFLQLCRKLLEDRHPGIQLEAAIHLAQSGIVVDPGDSRLFPLLMAGMENKQRRQEALDVRTYAYRQIPPGGSGNLFTNRPPGFPEVDQDLALRQEIRRSLLRLRHHLPEVQQEKINASRLGPPD